MSASFMASFIVYSLVGIYTLFNVDLPVAGGDGFIKFLVVMALFANAIYYYYYAFHIEQHEGLQNELKYLSTRYFEWILRVVALSVLFSLWIVLKRGWGSFCWWLIILYILYILWDIYIIVKIVQMFWLLIGDCIGLLLAASLLAIDLAIDKPTMKAIFALGIVTILYCLLTLGGLLVGKLFLEFEHVKHFKSCNLR